MQIIDNTSHLFGDDLKATLTRGSHVKIAASCFSIYAFEALKSELAKDESLQFIFTSPTFVKTEATDRLRKERREFFMPKAGSESSLYGTEFEIKLRNKLTQRAVARECAEWIRKKARFESNATQSPMQPLPMWKPGRGPLPICRSAGLLPSISAIRREMPSRTS